MSDVRSVAGRGLFGCHNLNVLLAGLVPRNVAMAASCSSIDRARDVRAVTAACADTRQEHHMRYAALIAASLMLAYPARAEKTPDVDPRASLGVVQQWIYNYRAKPDYTHVAAAVRGLFHSQTFKE